MQIKQVLHENLCLTSSCNLQQLLFHLRREEPHGQLSADTALRAGNAALSLSRSDKPLGDVS